MIDVVVIVLIGGIKIGRTAVYGLTNAVVFDVTTSSCIGVVFGSV
jgi:hypothetical protein